MHIIAGDNDMPHNLKHLLSLCHMQHDIVTSLVEKEIQTTTHNSTQIQALTLIVPVKIYFAGRFFVFLAEVKITVIFMLQ